MSWSNRYVGTPCQDPGNPSGSTDCWGLARRVYRQELGIDLPSYRGLQVCAAERAEIDALIGAAEAAGPWRPADVPAPFNILVFRRGRWRSHIGIRVDARRMLHVEGECQAVIAELRESRWRHRLTGEYRHTGLETMR